MQRHTIQVGSFEVNCSILEIDGKVLVIDPGQDADRIIAALEQRNLNPTAILLTHGHFDHVNGIPGLLKRFPDLPVYVSPEDAKVMRHPLNTLPPEYGPVAIDQSVRWDVERLEQWGVRTIPTPGHTPGGVCYYIPSSHQEPGAKRQALLFSGDTLFAGSVGRTDLPGGDMATLMDSLKKLTALPDDTLVIPGHGPFTSIAAERRGNPFLR